MRKYIFFEFTGVKSTAGWDLGGIGKWFKKVFDGDAFKDLWRTGRSVIDALAGSMGIPVAQLRSQLASEGINLDSYGALLEAALLEQGITSDNANIGTAEQYNNASAVASEQAQMTPQTRNLLWIICGAIALYFFTKGAR